MSSTRAATTPVITRRTVVRGAAWSVPVLLTTAAVPAWEASGEGPCTTEYPFTISGIKATWANNTSSPVTLTYVTSVPVTSVFNTDVTQVLGTLSDTNAYQPTAANTYLFTTGGTMTSNAATVANGTMTWEVTVTVPAAGRAQVVHSGGGASLTLGTQAGNCRATAPSATVQVTAPVLDCPFSYPIDCPF